VIGQSSCSIAQCSTQRRSLTILHSSNPLTQRSRTEYRFAYKQLIATLTGAGGGLFLTAAFVDTAALCAKVSLDAETQRSEPRFGNDGATGDGKLGRGR
jgi:hypothetical protein